MQIGNKIKEYRLMRGLTQQELADRSELTKGYISQLENDLTEPSINTFEDILNALGISFKEFFSDDDNKVVFKDEDYIVKEDNGVTTEWLVVNSQKNEMEPIRIKLSEGATTEVDMPHEGEEFGYVIRGKIILYLDKKKYIINQGETFYYPADKKHYIQNVYKGISEIIWISSPPNF